MKLEGKLRKMQLQPETPVAYNLVVDDTEYLLNPYLGHQLTIEYLGQINCIYCDRKTNKSFNQGYCYPCFQSLARCDRCIMKPELCHFHNGTCREPDWGSANCMQPHRVYLAQTSGVKVGITRAENVPYRWLDQGAIQAKVLFEVATRFHSGLVEVKLAQFIADKTNWRKMLQPPEALVDLNQFAAEFIEQIQPSLTELSVEDPSINVQPCLDSKVAQFEYPVLEYLPKITSINLEKTPKFTGTLLGMKGQYLIFDIGVINLRKYGGYQARISA